MIVYLITYVPDGDEGNPDRAYFKISKNDLPNAVAQITGTEKIEEESESADRSATNKDGKKDGKKDWDIMSYLQLYQWPIHVAVLLGIVLGMRKTYCD